MPAVPADPGVLHPVPGHYPDPRGLPHRRETPRVVGRARRQRFRGYSTELADAALGLGEPLDQVN